MVARDIPLAQPVPGFPGAYWAMASIHDVPDPSFLTSAEERMYETFTTDRRRNEWLAGRRAARSALRSVGAGACSVLRNIEGAPKLEGPGENKVEINITHGHTFAAAVATPKQAPWPYVGIDWIDEADTDRIRRVAHRFLSQDEHNLCGEDTTALQLAWGAREAVAKATRTGMFMFALSRVQLTAFDPSTGAAEINLTGTFIRFLRAPTPGLIVLAGVDEQTRSEANRLARGRANPPT